MKGEQQTVHSAFYKRLLALYPMAFRDRFAESMEQTFADSCGEHTGSRIGLFKFTLRTYADTCAGIVKEQMLQLTQGKTMIDTILDPRLGAVVGFLLFLPFFLTFTISTFDVEPVAGALKSLTTGVGGELNTIGRILMFGGVVALPVALLVSLFSMLTKRRIEKGISFHPRTANLLVMALVLIGIVIVAQFAILEAVNCASNSVCD
jgi:hypothetical protein